MENPAVTIAHKDFTPEVTRDGFFSRDMEPLSDCLRRANDWIADANPRIVNVETVVLPNMHAEEGSEDPDISTSGEMHSSWHQFIRVWYET
jgi:hypothetical protein